MATKSYTVDFNLKLDIAFTTTITFKDILISFDRNQQVLLEPLASSLDNSFYLKSLIILKMADVKVGQTQKGTYLI